jgi:protein-S-isoprenylcysteine O-methyltransferase Ste14
VRPTPFFFVAVACWWALSLAWLPGYFVRLRRRDAPTPYRGWQVVATPLLLLSFLLLFAPRPVALRIAVTPPNTVLGIVGDALAIAGVAFAIWARVTLGRNWSGLVMMVREGQGLVQRGPYAIVRHPIYAGILAAVVGTALTRGTLASWLGVAAGLAGVLIRVEIEDRLMAAEFGEAHAAYRKRTRKLIPFVW